MKNAISKRENETVFLVKMVILALFIRFCIGAAYYNAFIAVLKKPLYAFDGEAYSIIGWYITLVLKGINISSPSLVFIPNDYAGIGGLLGTIESFHGALPPVVAYGVGLYSYIIGIFYYIFGYTPVLLRFFNSGISVASGFLVYGIAKRNFNQMVARVSFILMLFMPSLILYSASLQRDTLINFFLLLTVSQVLKINGLKHGKDFILALIFACTGMVLLYYLRQNTVMVLSVFIVLFLYLNFAFAYKRVAPFLLFFILVTSSLFASLLDFLKSKFVMMLSYHIGFFTLGGFNINLLPNQYYLAENSSARLSSIHYIAWNELINAIFNGIAAFIFEPSPLQIYKIRQLVSIPYMFVWYAIIFFAAIGLYNSIKEPTIGKVSLMAIMLLFTISIGMSEANMETLIRHRDMVVPIYIIFAAKGIEAVYRRKNQGPL